MKLKYNYKKSGLNLALFLLIVGGGLILVIGGVIPLIGYIILKGINIFLDHPIIITYIKSLLVGAGLSIILSRLNK